MLLQAKNPLLRRSGGGVITFRGSASASVTNGGTPSVNLSSITGLAQNDIVIVMCVGTANDPTVPSGWTQIHDNQSWPSAAPHKGQCVYKIMGASPDSSVAFADSGATSESSTALAFAFTGVDTGTPFDVTSTEASLGNANSPDPAAITPSANNCMIVVMGGSSVTEADVGSITNYTQPTTHQVTSNDNVDTTTAGAYRLLVGGGGASEDPPAWSSWTNGASWSVTMALRPAT